MCSDYVIAVKVCAEMHRSGTQGVCVDRGMCPPDLSLRKHLLPQLLQQIVSTCWVIASTAEPSHLAARFSRVSSHLMPDEGRREARLMCSTGRQLWRFTQAPEVAGVWWDCRACAAARPLPLLSSDALPSTLGVLLALLYEHLRLGTLSHSLLFRKSKL